MAYNKKERLKANIDAIKTVFILEKEGRQPTKEEQFLLKQYAGFGGLKCVLNPANSLADTAYWAKSELDLFPLTADLHRVLKESTANENEYKRYMNSIKNSVLTAFYTPPDIVNALTETLLGSGITPMRVLDPSAGTGEFAHSFFQSADHPNELICFEKDILTGKMLSALTPGHKVNVEGFETIESRYNNYFDVVSSNIPFGEMNVFDAAFMKQDQLHRDSTRAIHNYFFIKGVESLREGGVLAFITSQGVMNSPNNTPVRKWLMENTNLVSAIRLPNNLFTDYAGTEVGSDLIVLQKNTGKDPKLNFWENLFIGTSQSELTGIYTNDYFYNNGRVVHTKASIGTDPYGKPVQIFVHQGGVEGMAADMKKMLESDFKSYLNPELYNNRVITPKQTKPQTEILFNEVVKEEVKEKNTEHSLQEKAVYPDDLDPFWQAVEDHFFPEEKEFWNKEAETVPKEQAGESALNIEKPQPATQAPVMSLYDLFGFTEQERSQVKPVRGGTKKNTPPKGKPVQLSMFSSNGQSSGNNKATAYPIADARKEEQQEALWQEEKKLSFELRPFTGELKEYHKQGSLVEDQGQIGYLKERYRDGAEFQPLDLPFAQRSKISRYMEVRDFYHELYNHEAKHLTVHESLRGNLNLVYDNFVRRFGNLNDKKNLDVIKMDAGGTEILSLERAIDGKLQKADIFHGPVAFNPNELKVAGTSDEALIASLNKYGEVRLDYMESLMTDKGREEMIADLHGRIFFNPLIQ
ncbi:MAG: N-6 DNA methylase, partial [Prevotella sp.]|nr:N-6 DNA methylase [Prevotella sp.]